MAWLALAVIASPLGVANGATREEQALAQRATAELKASLALKPWSQKEIAGLIRQERFLEFEALSAEAEEKFKNEPKYEAALIKLYDTVRVEDHVLLQKLDKWVATRPSAASHTARGIYNVSRGFRARGTNYSRETSPARMATMAKYHAQAIPDLLMAIKANRAFAPAYMALIDVQRASGDTMSAERTATEAARWIPQTYYIRYAYLIALRPRWGGDYTLMQAYVNSLDEAARLNPRIWSLKGEVPALLGLNAWEAGDYPAAIKHYTEALSFGDRASFLKDRGRVFLDAKQYAAARRDFERYAQYVANDAEVDSWRRYLEQLK